MSNACVACTCDHDSAIRIVHAPLSPMCKIIKKIRLYAQQDKAVLILGETGTGKDLVAESVYRTSSRANGSFVCENCGSLDESLLQIKLFGQEKNQNDPRAPGYPMPGLFERANGGTLFLDEIGELPEKVQVNLLRVLEDKQVTRELGTRKIAVNFRLIAATSRSLGEMIATGLFRRELFYRLNVLSITLPPLRERVQDIPVLFRHFAQEAGYSYVLNDDALACLKQYTWPGNVRELQNLLAKLTAGYPNGGEVTIEMLEEHLGPDVLQSIRRKAEAIGEKVSLTIIAVDDFRGNREVWEAAQENICKTLNSRYPTVENDGKVMRLSWGFKAVSPADIPNGSDDIRDYLSNCALILIDLDYGEEPHCGWASGYHLWGEIYRNCPWLWGAGCVFYSKHKNSPTALQRLMQEARVALQPLDLIKVLEEQLGTVHLHADLPLKHPKETDGQEFWSEIENAIVDRLAPRLRWLVRPSPLTANPAAQSLSPLEEVRATPSFASPTSHSCRAKEVGALDEGNIAIQLHAFVRERADRNNRIKVNVALLNLLAGQTPCLIPPWQRADVDQIALKRVFSALLKKMQGTGPFPYDAPRKGQYKLNNVGKYIDQYAVKAYHTIKNGFCKQQRRRRTSCAN